MNKEKKTKASIDNIYTLNGKVPLGHAVPFGLQHILAMFVANIAPIIIVANACKLSNGQIAMLIQSAMLIAGIGTLIQLFPIWRVGSGLPIVMGISFTFVSILCFIGTTYGYETIVGAVLVGGILEGTLGLFAKYWLKWISPIVAASVVTAIGFSLLSVGSASFGGGSGSENFGSVQNWIIGTVTLLSCILFNLFAKSYFKQLSVLFGLVVGYILAVCMHQVAFSALWLSADYFFQPECWSCGNDKSCEPVCYCDWRGDYDFGRYLSDFRCCACNASGFRPWRMYDYDVWYNCSQWYPDDWKMWIYPEKHYHSCVVLKRGNRFYPGAGDFCDFSSDCAKCICSELRSSSLFSGCNSQSGTAEKYGSKSLKILKTSRCFFDIMLLQTEMITFGGY